MTTEDQKRGVFIRIQDLIRFSEDNARGTVSRPEIGRLIAEVFRLRAKCRALMARLKAAEVERDAFAELILHYAPRPARAAESSSAAHAESQREPRCE